MDSRTWRRWAAAVGACKLRRPCQLAAVVGRRRRQVAVAVVVAAVAADVVGVVDDAVVAVAVEEAADTGAAAVDKLRSRVTWSFRSACLSP